MALASDDDSRSYKDARVKIVLLVAVFRCIYDEYHDSTARNSTTTGPKGK